MAKKKTKAKKQSVQPLSPERYICEKGRNLPVVGCYVTPNWKECGMAQVVVVREMPSGNFVIGIFIVDTFCLGLKDAIYKINMPESEVDGLLENIEDGVGLEEMTYNEAHNIIYGAIEFAMDGGIKPPKVFSVAQYVLEEDTDAVPIIDYEFGKNGRHFLVASPDGSEKRHIGTLRKYLGDDFDYILPESIYEEDDDFEQFADFESDEEEDE